MCVRVCVCETSQLAESVLKLKQNGWCEAGNAISKSQLKFVWLWEVLNKETHVYFVAYSTMKVIIYK